MKILYDHQAFGQRVGGVSRSYTELIKYLDPVIEWEIAIRYSQNVYLKDILPGINYPFGRTYIPFKRRIINKRNFEFAIDSLINSEYDLFHATFDDPYFLPYVKTPFVITVHDLIPEHEPAKWPETWLKSRNEVFKTASHIIAVSENTKKELLFYYPGISTAKITVIYHAYASSNETNRVEKSKYGDYILFVGGRQGYKNFSRFIEGIAPVLIDNDHLNLVCTGSKLTKEEKEFLSKLGILNRVISNEFDEITLNSLYKNALFLAFPSILEGFGMPILEAWGNGCPVVLSNSSCFPEIAADAAVYFNPMDPNNIREVISRFLADIHLREDVKTKSKERLKLFTWKNSASKLEQVYRNVLDA